MGDVSYLSMMQKFRSGKPYAALLEVPQRARSRASNPLSVDRSYSRRRSLQSDLKRYYEECKLSSAAKRFAGPRLKQYCAGDAWKRIKESGRYSDYPGFSKRNPMAKKKRGLAGRKRDAKGRLLPRASKKRAASKRRVKRAKSAAGLKVRRGFTRKAPAGSKKKRVRVKPRTSRHRVKQHTRRIGRKKVTRVRGHMSWEAGKRRRRRKSRRSVAEEVAMALEAHKKKSRRRRKARRHHASAAEPRKRRRTRRRGRARTAKVRVSRKVRGRRRSTTVRVSARKRPRAKKVTLTRRRRGRKVKRDVYVSEARRRRRRARRHHAAAPRRRRRRSYAAAPRRRRYRRRSRSMHTFYENPIMGLGGGGLMENPLSGGELALAFITGTIGFAATDLLDRYMATRSATDASSAAAAIAMAPDWTRIAAQGAAAVVPLGLAYLVKHPMARATVQGFGLGAGFHLLGQIVKTIVLAKVLKNNTMAQTKLLPDVLAANPGTVAGLPAGVGRLPVGVGMIAPVQAGNYLPVGPVATSPLPADGAMPNQGGCDASTANAALVSAHRAAMRDTYDQGALGAVPSYKTKPGRMEIPD